jgi:MFS transporter, putative metabolite:H+ symporter
MEKKQFGILSLPVIVAALGYFVDIYDLLLFTIVRKPSLETLGVDLHNAKLVVAASTKVINWQMWGMLIGGIIWGIMGDKRGRLSVLFGSIILYSVANFLTGYVQDVQQYAWARFVAGVGLAGELGAGITLVSELLPRAKRGVGTSMVAGIGLFGAVAAYFTYKISGDWRLCYRIGGVLGILLLFLRISVTESGMFKHVQQRAGIVRGNIFLFFQDAKRFRKYILAILIGLPTWFVIGILVNLSDQFANKFYEGNKIESGRAIMYAYAAIAIGDILVGLVSQYFKSRKKALYLFYFFAIISGIYFFSGNIKNDASMYAACAALGFSTGFWAIFVTMGAEQFGTNLRATAATTIPNMVRGSLPLINLMFVNWFQLANGWDIIKSAIYTGVVVMAITLIAAYFTEETFHKDLNYVEPEELMP